MTAVATKRENLSNMAIIGFLVCLVVIVFILFIFTFPENNSKRPEARLIPSFARIDPVSEATPTNSFCTSDLECKNKLGNGKATCVNFTCSLEDAVTSTCNEANDCYAVFVGNPLTGTLSVSCLSYSNQDWTSESNCDSVQDINCEGTISNGVCTPTDSTKIGISIPLPFTQGSIWITLVNNSAAQRIQQ